MTAPTPEATAEAIRHALGLADTLAGDWALIHYDATYPRGVDRDRPTRAVPIAPHDPDYVMADRDDPGVGDHRARRACNEASRHIAIAHRLAFDAVVLMVGKPVHKYQRPPRDAVTVRGVVQSAAGYLRLLQAVDAGRWSTDTRQAAHGAASALIAAHAALRAVMADYEHVGEPTLDRRCWNCLRPVEAPRRECEACRKYRARAEQAIRAGKTVPHRLRPVPRYDDAHRARQRREARLKPGQLDIEAPVPSGNWVDGEYRPATPHPEPDRKRAS